jgi:AcrR family transcriptional regulator
VAVTATDPTSSTTTRTRPPARRRRSDRAVANDGRILDAALRVLRQDGYDGLGMSHVAREAGLNSTGALYGRFENVAELAVWVWTETASAALTDVSTRAIALLDAPGIDGETVAEAQALATRLTAPDDSLRAAIELLAVSARVEELEEVVRPDVEAIVEAAGATVGAIERRRAQVLGQLALAWGIGLLSLPSTAPPLEWWMLVAGSAGLTDDRTRVRKAGPPVPVTQPRPDTGEPVRDVVLAAAAAVVARTGFERATVSRIARRAGYSTGVIYEYYERKDEMIAELVEVLLDTLYVTVTERDGDLIAEGRLADLSGALLAGYVLPEARELQRLKVELYLAAAHQPDVADALGRVLARHATDLQTRLEAAGLSTEEAVLAPSAGRAIDHGIALVDAMVGPLLDVDWRLYIQALVSRNV